MHIGCSKVAIDWSFDPIQAARLELGGEVGRSLVKLTQNSQGFVNGMAKWEANGQGILCRTDGHCRRCFAGSAGSGLRRGYPGCSSHSAGMGFRRQRLRAGKTKVDVQTRNGAITTVVIEAGTTQTLKIRNPWPGQPVDVFPEEPARELCRAQRGRDRIRCRRRHQLSCREPRPTHRRRPFAPVSGNPASSPKKLGAVQIGLFRGD